MSLSPYPTRAIKQAIARVRKSNTRDMLVFQVKDAGDQIKRELNESKHRMGKAMQKAVEEQKELLALLHELNEVTKQQVDRLKPEEHHP
uniref:Uncharacterized protein n=1 Tax=viral metagenome TaxID=1070528 RepID=A0A6M3X4C9_9ZZZZ